MADTQPAEQGTHFWHMAIQVSGPNARSAIHAFSGTITPAKGRTRYDLYKEILAAMKAQYLPGLDCAAVAFDVQSNQL